MKAQNKLCQQVMRHVNIYIYISTCQFLIKLLLVLNFMKNGDSVRVVLLDPGVGTYWDPFRRVF